MAVSLAGLFSFISLAFLLRIGETLRLSPAMPPSLTPASLSMLPQGAGFTPRELDIVKLLIDGSNTQQMLDKLVIAPDTLKSHLRNICRKVAVRNRVEFTLSLMKDVNPSGKTQNSNSAANSKFN